MHQIAFYAPMKSPLHAVPSGDRQMARGLMSAMDATPFQVLLANEFRSYEKTGNPETQRKLLELAKAEVDHLLQHPDAEKWRAWITYHNYYKAPDLLGPAISKHLSIPYVLIEATRARKRMGGPWDVFARAAEAACDQASTIFYLTDRDHEALAANEVPGQRLQKLNPFLPQETLPDLCTDTIKGQILSVGMMRGGDKRASYDLIAQALKEVQTPDWSLRIVGAGPEERSVRAMFARFGDRVSFAGELGDDDLSDAYKQASVFLWPGVNEAFGMVYLEAQAHGLPVVAQDRPGVRDVLANRTQPSPSAGPQAIATRLDDLLMSAEKRTAEAAEARQFVKNHHLITTARQTLLSEVNRLIGSHS